MMAGMKAPSVSTPRERFLTEEEIAALWEAWPTLLPPRVTLALKLALVTGQRIGEVTGMMEDELDLRKGIWTIPASRSKNGIQHVVPLTNMALALIKETRATAVLGRMFPGLNSVKIGQQIIRYRDRLPVSDWTAHDLRRTVCTHLAKMGIPPLQLAPLSIIAKSLRPASPLACMSNTITTRRSGKPWSFGPIVCGHRGGGVAPKIIPMTPRSSVGGVSEGNGTHRARLEELKREEAGSQLRPV